MSAVARTIAGFDVGWPVFLYEGQKRTTPSHMNTRTISMNVMLLLLPDNAVHNAVLGSELCVGARLL